MTLPVRNIVDSNHSSNRYTNNHTDIMMTMMMMARPSETGNKIESNKNSSITVRPIDFQNRLSSSSSSRSARKRDGNNLKFHNFVPNSESISENCNDVYGHCLREEHGSKQIYVCNWRKQSPIIVDDRLAIAEKSSPTYDDDNSENNGHKTCSSSSPKTLTGYHIQNLLASEKSIYGQKSILQSLLVKHGCNVSINGENMINHSDNDDDRDVDDNGDDDCDDDEDEDGDDDACNLHQFDGDYKMKSINRRKPSTIRRVLRSDESSNDEPLDLCVRKKAKIRDKKGDSSEQSVNIVNCSEAISYLPIMISTVNTACHPEISPNLINNHLQGKKLIPVTSTDTQITSQQLVNNPLIVSNPPINIQLQPNIGYKSCASKVLPENQQNYRLIASSSSSSSPDNIYPIVLNQVNHHHHATNKSQSIKEAYFTPHQMTNVHLQSSPLSSSSSSSSSSTNSRLNIGPTSDHNLSSNNNAINCQSQNRLIKGRSSERSVIKKKLEDAFRTNGFLVKTKEVSDGDATFCKFRQLRKYTRYYLKSWHQHLPEEINKLWKGFLPPKTIKPATSSSSVLSSNSSNSFCHQQQIQAQQQHHLTATKLSLPVNQMQTNNNH